MPQSLSQPHAQAPRRSLKFVPLPRVHRHRYHGVLAPNARLGRVEERIGEARAEADGIRLEAGVTCAA
jgi:hypothetical protein